MEFKGVIFMTLGERLKMLRNKQKPKLSQETLSEELGINRSTYARYETGDNDPGYKTLIKIADFYKVSLDYLIRGIVKQEQDKVYSDESTN
ncbi:helix-turn-helix transcriptional regulator [Bacillus licheniformis]|uniref:helix-turn-helix domain-containing protein n=2 Tax=Bacillus TaxID=1386 RepID=UPI0002F7E92B|nr:MULTISPECIES: helix-turn-helix transcriptional regulator [Bacillus]ARC62541.1 HTH-type transcriptional regulator Xre [Bacillus licheniformis]KJE30826.1 helix-turn-helix family protein [Bacillus licheniformis]MCR3918329.1 helix-turn-helix domain-containing protein [Bacillus licheniformis]MCZ0106035.1 helix-turn-helix transcriptional regulator [Bacillus licheniformis]MDE1367479.1 helix-turn-helix transcriptional regulator [Bacillus licheniformis]